MSTDEHILEFDPFEGDFSEQGDTVLSNKMVVAAKEHECCHCKNTIAKGERHRCQTGKYGDFMTHRWCADCCALMARIVSAEDHTEYGDDDCDVFCDAVLAFEKRATQPGKQGEQTNG